MTSAATFARWLKAAMGARFNVVRGCTMRRPDGDFAKLWRSVRELASSARRFRGCQDADSRPDPDGAAAGSRHFRWPGHL